MGVLEQQFSITMFSRFTENCACFVVSVFTTMILWFNLFYIMLKNENGKPSKKELDQAQKESNSAKALRDFLELVILGKDNGLDEFSDMQMIQNLTYIQSHNTVRKVRKKLESECIIENTRVSANNEKFYRIIDYEKAVLLYNQSIATYVKNRKHKPNIGFTPTKIIEKPPVISDNNFHMILQINGKTIRSWNYPKIMYEKNTCPICSGRLIHFKHGTLGQITHDLDRKCRNCTSKFYYNKPSKKHANDDSIIIDTTNVIVNQYLLGNLVDKSKMHLLMTETKRILGEANPKWRDFFENV